ncbi:hypothetical protein MMC11_000969 [Xylographa trunciseda]|nr:hypothetical protein [Xylographa trunciseda]
MALSLAPYHDGMRIGQGFHSFVQEIRMDNAVIRDVPQSLTPKEVATTNIGPTVPTTNLPIAPAPIVAPATAPLATPALSPPANVSQIVSYSSRFVDKLSEVTDAMSISGPMSIKAGVVGGSANGSFIDADKFRQSDINYFIQVKVTNQPQPPMDYLVFNPLPKLEGYTPEGFTDIYGDTFISGFIEGGEFDAIISFRLKREPRRAADLEQVKRSIERCLRADVRPAVNEHRKALALEEIAETTIVVNWSGGGNIKPLGQPWTLENISLVAADFASRVSDTPQKIYAILTSYMSLRSFRTALTGLRPLDYSNAKIYASELLDAYMEYCTILKKLQMMAEDVRDGDSVLVPREIPEEIQSLFGHTKEVIPKLVKDVHEGDADEEDDGAAGKEHYEHLEEPEETIHDTHAEHLQPYQASLIGLERARRDCRAVMMQIVAEVDGITLNPRLAEDPGRHPAFLSPDIFIKLIPDAEPVHREHLVEVEEPNDLETEDVEDTEELYAEDSDGVNDQIEPEENGAEDEAEDEEPYLNGDAEHGDEAEAESEVEYSNPLHDTVSEERSVKRPTVRSKDPIVSAPATKVKSPAQPEAPAKSIDKQISKGSVKPSAEKPHAHVPRTSGNWEVPEQKTESKTGPRASTRPVKHMERSGNHAPATGEPKIATRGKPKHIYEDRKHDESEQNDEFKDEGEPHQVHARPSSAPRLRKSPLKPSTRPHDDGDDPGAEGFEPEEEALEEPSRWRPTGVAPRVKMPLCGLPREQLIRPEKLHVAWAYDEEVESAYLSDGPNENPVKPALATCGQPYIRDEPNLNGFHASEDDTSENEGLHYHSKRERPQRHSREHEPEPASTRYPQNGTQQYENLNDDNHSEEMSEGKPPKPRPHAPVASSRHKLHDHDQDRDHDPRPPHTSEHRPHPRLPRIPFTKAPSTSTSARSISVLYPGPRPLFPAAASSLASLPPSLGLHFQLSDYGGLPPRGSAPATFFNDLEALASPPPRVTHVHVWWAHGAICGLRTTYADGRALSHGDTSTDPAVDGAGASSAGVACMKDEHVIAVKLFVARNAAVGGGGGGGGGNGSAVACVRLITSAAETHDLWGPDEDYVDVQTSTALAPGGVGAWGLVGFYGEWRGAVSGDAGAKEEGRRGTRRERVVVERLGVVWGKV